MRNIVEHFVQYGLHLGSFGIKAVTTSSSSTSLGIKLAVLIDCTITAEVIAGFNGNRCGATIRGDIVRSTIVSSQYQSFQIRITSLASQSNSSWKRIDCSESAQHQSCNTDQSEVFHLCISFFLSLSPTANFVSNQRKDRNQSSGNEFNTF
jgi:hypothetical protein